MKYSGERYNCLIFMETGCEIKVIETQSDVIREINLIGLT